MDSVQIVKYAQGSLNYNDQPNKFAITETKKQYAMTEYQSNSLTYGTVTFNIIPNGEVVSSHILFKYQYKLKITGTAAGTNLLEPGFYSITPNIFLSCSNINTVIDTASQGIQCSDVVPLLLPYKSTVDNAFCTQNVGGYSDYSSLVGSTYESANIFSDKYIHRIDGVDLYGFQRYNNTYFTVDSNTSTQAIITVSGECRLPTGMTEFMENKEEMFLACTKISLVLNFNNLAETFKYMTPGTPGASVITAVNVVDSAGNNTVNFSEYPLIRLLTCAKPFEYTKELYYNTATTYTPNIQNYVRNLSPGAETLLNFTNLQLQGIPNNLYIMVTDNDQTLWKTGNALSILQLDVQVGVAKQNLVQLDQFDLFEISRKCNYQYDLKTFLNNSVVCIPFSMLVDGNTNFSGGVNQNVTMSMKITVKNPSSSQLITNIKCVLLSQYDGIMTTSMLSMGRKTLNYNFITDEAYATAPYVWSDSCEGKQIRKTLNGGWVGSLISAIPSVIGAVSSIASVAKPIAQRLLCDQPNSQPIQPSGAGLVKGGAVYNREQLRQRI